MEYFAHSEKDNYPSQTYVSHVKGVCDQATMYANEVESYAKLCNGLFTNTVLHSALLHDLGKLDDCNQVVLRQKTTTRHLPLNHVDAGAAELLRRGNLYSALAVYSHHKGLPDLEAEVSREETAVFRDEQANIRTIVDASLEKLLQRHTSLISQDDKKVENSYTGNQSVFFRMMLSCLTDADHSDTAAAYGQICTNNTMLQLLASKRLMSLNNYVMGLAGNDERSKLRMEMYYSCRDTKTNSSFTICDSPVGSGKTTAVMAHLLQQAITRKSRRIFVVLPYTSIIRQSVNIYRKALSLPGENPEEVVAELHCRTDFQDCDVRYLTALWRAPIIVTTAVSFFETLASNRPASLRRLHELPGSIIFIDESHNALPLKLLPLAWHWMNVLAEEWSCYWVMASGSLVRFWQLNSLRDIAMPHPCVKELIDSSLHNRLMKYENDRITFRWKAEPLNLKKLVAWIQSFPGPRLLIMNTVQSAAVVADALCTQFGRKYVEHLSTALTAADRGTVIERVKTRLKDEHDHDWTLVAISCVEAGVDFSFRTGFREISSLLSLLQASGRVNRHGRFQGAEMWSFSMQEESMLKKNSSLNTSAEVLTDFFNKETTITAELSTQSMNDEIIRDDSCLQEIRKLLSEENAMQFKTVADSYKVIDSNTVTVVVDKEFSQQIISRKSDWQQLQKSTVSIRRNKIQTWRLKKIANDIYQWTLRYDSFLGYMRGVLDIEKQS